MKWPWQKSKSVDGPREAWVVLLDAEGLQLMQAPVFLECDPLAFAIDHALTHEQYLASPVRAVRVYDANGFSATAVLPEPVA